MLVLFTNHETDCMVSMGADMRHVMLTFWHVEWIPSLPSTVTVSFDSVNREKNFSKFCYTWNRQAAIGDRNEEVYDESKHTL